MNRLILGSTLAGLVAAGVFLFRPAPDSADAENDSSFRPMSRAASSEAAEEGKAFKGSHVRPLPAAGPFVTRSEAIAAMQRTTEREEAIRSLAQEWAAEDPKAAERWAAAFEDPADAESALTHVCLAVADRHPLDAIGMAQRHGLGGGMLEVIAGRWAASDFDAAALWVNELPEGASRNGLLAKLALHRAATDPEGAASMIAVSLTAGNVQEEAAMSVLHQWLLKDPDAAGAWIDAFPEGPLKERARREIQGMTAYLQERRNEREQQ